MMPPNREEPRPLSAAGALETTATTAPTIPQDTRDAAVAAARHGWHVFPCRLRDKRPVVDRWEQRACADPERVGRYWPASANVGIACGPSGLIVIDLDTHDEIPEEWRLPGIRDGRDVLAQLAAWAGQLWPSTYTVATPLTGWHLYYRAPEHAVIRNSAGALGPSIDVRAAGGYVLAAGSVVDERAYPGRPDLAARVRGGSPYEVLDAGQPEPLPGWLRRLLAPATKNVVSKVAKNVVSKDGRLAALVRTVEAGQPGDRNGRLHWSACRAAEMVAAGEVDEVTATEALVTAAMAAGLRGGEREARRTVASGMRGAAQ